MYLLTPKVEKEVSYYHEKWIDRDKITKMIDLCIKNNIEIKAINLEV